VIVDNLTLIGASWGAEYFERWGDRWLASILALDPAPAQIVVATDRELPLPSHFKQVRAEQPYHWEAFNGAARAVETEWLCGLALDDTLPPDALQDIDMSGDVEASWALDSNGTLMKPRQEKWMNILNEDWYPLSGYQIIKRDVFLAFPYRPIEWPDWVQALEWRDAGIQVRFTERVRQNYTLHADQHSRVRNYEVAMARIRMAKQMIMTRGMKPGNCWPPEGK
jgi:hypothetical protein